MRGYHSQLAVVLPKRELLEELSGSIGDNRHRVFSAELACDRLYLNQPETKVKQRQITKVLRKKWSPNVRIFDSTVSVSRPRRVTDPEYQHEKYDSQTTYAGGPNFEYTIYARISKMTELPCVHCEWKISGSYMMRKRTGVRTIHDLLDLNVERTFNSLCQSYIAYEEIDHEKHGRFVQNMTADAPTPGRVRAGQRAGARKLPFDRASHTYLRVYEIKNASQLRKHYTDSKREIDAKANRGETLTTTENKIKSLSTNKLNAFFISLPDQFFENS